MHKHELSVKITIVGPFFTLQKSYITFNQGWILFTIFTGLRCEFLNDTWLRPLCPFLIGRLIQTFQKEMNSCQAVELHNRHCQDM